MNYLSNMHIKLSVMMIGWFIFLACFSVKLENRVSIKIPSIEQESSSIWRTINDINFLQEQEYTISIPDNRVVEDLIKKSRSGMFGSQDFSTIYELLESEIYNKSSYSAAFEKVVDEQQLINSIIIDIEKMRLNWDWDFKVYNNYDIVLTLYGSGGSYDPDTGTITLLTDERGGFRRYDNAVNTIIHEIIHLGMEESIVQKYELPHQLKEQLVDQVVTLLFHDLLPEYKVQEMGDIDYDYFPKYITDLKNLNQLLSTE